MSSNIVIRKYFGINVVRDDLLPGGTKSVLMPEIIDPGKTYVYASPVFGGFQIALAAYCGQRAVIFCAKRGKKHENTLEVLKYGGKVVEVPNGFLSVVEARAREYAEKTGAVKLDFGAKNPTNIGIIRDRVKQAIQVLGSEPEEIWCAIGSGTLVSAILEATTTARIKGVEVGQKCGIKHERLQVIVYPKSFDKPSAFDAPFKSMKNYDLKAFEYCVKYKKSKNVLFWNVL